MGTGQTFQWDKATNATSYLLCVQDVTAGTATKIYAISSGSTTSFAIRLTAGHAYQWSMCACAGSSQGLPSIEYCFTIHTLPSPNPSKPPTPPPVPRTPG